MSTVPNTSAATLERLPNLGQELADLGFTDLGVKRRFGLPASDESLVAMQRPLLDFRGAGDDEAPLDVLIQLFIVGCTVRRASLDHALSAASRQTLLDANLVELDEDRARANVAIVPWRGLLVTSDRVDHMFDPEYVLFLNPCAAYLAPFVAPANDEARGHAVDVGTGCGVLAMLAARHFERVTAVDINPRAIAFTTFNAALNDLAIDAQLCQPTFFADTRWQDIDLLMFNFPTMYQAHFISRSVAFRSEMGETLLRDGYAATSRMLSPTGRFAFTHQSRTLPTRYFEQLLAGTGCTEQLSVVWISGGALTPIGYHGLEWGVALGLRPGPGRRAPGFEVFDAPAGLFQVGREDISRFLTSLDIIAAGTAALRTAVPSLPPGLTLTRTHIVCADRLTSDDGYRCHGATLGAPDVELLQRVDARATVEQLAALGGASPVETEAALDRFAALARSGHLYLAHVT